MCVKERYEIEIEWSDEDACFVARFPQFPYVGAHGDTVENSRSEARVALGVALQLREERRHGGE
jgi:predicted RNase H-like HicB family nuclease